MWMKLLCISEIKIFFTAVEIKTLLPVCGKEAMNNFFEANEWTSELLPACSFRHQQIMEPSKPWLEKCTEWMFDNKMGGWLDNC